MPYRSARVRLAQADTWLLEVFLSFYTLVWGLGFANPLTDSFGANPGAYAILGRFPGGEVAFGVLVTLLGGLLLGVAIKGCRPLRGWAAGAVGLFWAAILVVVGVPTQWAAGGLPHFGLVALAHWYCWVRLSSRGLG